MWVDKVNFFLVLFFSGNVRIVVNKVKFQAVINNIKL